MKIFFSFPRKIDLLEFSFFFVKSITVALECARNYLLFLHFLRHHEIIGFLLLHVLFVLVREKQMKGVFEIKSNEYQYSTLLNFLQIFENYDGRYLSIYTLFFGNHC